MKIVERGFQYGIEILVGDTLEAFGNAFVTFIKSTKVSVSSKVSERTWSQWIAIFGENF